MVNIKYKQAAVTCKISEPGGEPVDIHGQLAKISGRKQAAALLAGHDNPDSDKYEIEKYSDETQWVLEEGVWNMSGVWQDNGVWKY